LSICSTKISNQIIIKTNFVLIVAIIPRSNPIRWHFLKTYAYFFNSSLVHIVETVKARTKYSYYVDIQDKIPHSNICCKCNRACSVCDCGDDRFLKCFFFFRNILKYFIFKFNFNINTSKINLKFLQILF
jgi:hypothetical protein